MHTIQYNTIQYIILVGKLQSKRQLLHLGLYERIILKWIFRKIGCENVNWIQLAEGSAPW